MQKTMRLNLTDIMIQLFLIFCLFFAFTGGAFLIGWEQLKYFRDLHRFFSIAFVIVGGVVSYCLYLKDKNAFFDLEPIKSIKRFFEMPAIISVSILTFVYFATQLIYLIVMHSGLGTSLWDLGIYDQVIWNTAHDHFLITSIRGGLHVFCEHFKPILTLLSPIYWFGNNTVPLFVVFTLITSGSVALAYLISKNVTRSHQTSLIFAFCVFFYRPMRNGIDFLFHTQALADPFLLFGFFFVLRNQLKRAIFFFCLALMCKENIATDVLGIGLFFISRKVKGGWLISFLALSFLALFVFVIEPHFRYPYHFLNKWNLYSHFVNPTRESWMRLLDPNPLVFLFLVFSPFFFLSFKCKGWYWLLGPSLALRLLSGMPGFRLTTVHYTAGLNALVIISAIYGFASLIHSRTGKAEPKFAGGIGLFKNRNAILILLLFSAFVFSGRPQLFAIDRYLSDASKSNYQRIVKILESVPPQYSVLTNEMASAHLSHRAYLYVFFSMFPHAPLEEAARHPDLVVEDTERIRDNERDVVKGFVTEGYRLLFEYSFIKIYVSPSSKVSHDLVAKWEEFKHMPGVPYRTVVQFWYRWILAISILFLFVLLLVRGNALTLH